MVTVFFGLPAKVLFSCLQFYHNISGSGNADGEDHLYEIMIIPARLEIILSQNKRIFGTYLNRGKIAWYSRYKRD